MAADGTFFKPLATVNARTHAPVLAIVAQGAVAVIITLFLNYDQILNYVTSNDYIFFGFSAIALIVFRNRDAREPNAPRPFFSMPGHPYSTVIFLAAAWFIVADTIWNSPRDTLIGVAILLPGSLSIGYSCCGSAARIRGNLSRRAAQHAVDAIADCGRLGIDLRDEGANRYSGSRVLRPDRRRRSYRRRG